MKKIIVLGHSSFVASHLPYEKVADYLIPDRRVIYHFLDRHQPEVIVNCAGCTGRPNIDFCEAHKLETYTANVVIPLMLAGICEERKVKFIHIGSGCIFMGQSPNTILVGPALNDIPEVMADLGWNEKDHANPQSFYSKTKAAADLVLGDMPNVCALRIRMPVSGADNPRNLLSKITSYKQVVETPNSITFMSDLKRAIDWVIEKDLHGIYNVCHTKSFTHSDFLNEYKKYFPSHTWESITPEQLNNIVSSPRSNCIIDSSKLTTTGFQFEDAQKQMENCVREFAKAKLNI
jgi:3,5-epimerase/4-reductase